MFAKQSQYNSKNRNCFTCSAQQHLFLKCPTEDKGCDSVDIQMSLIRSFLNIQSQWPNSDLWNMCISFDEVIENSMHIIWRQNFTLGISSTKTRQNCQWPPSNVCYLKCHSFPYTLKITVISQIKLPMPFNVQMSLFSGFKYLKKLLLFFKKLSW